jgi:hypothetical protein
MPRKSLNKVYCYIEVPISTDDKEAFRKWCEVNGLTMSEVIRREIAPIVNQGYSLL